MPRVFLKQGSEHQTT